MEGTSHPETSLRSVKIYQELGGFISSIFKNNKLYYTF